MLGKKTFKKRHLSCLDMYLVSIWACKKQFQHMKCTRLWIHEDSTFPQSSPGWTCIIMFKTKVPIERQCASMRLMCVWITSTWAYVVQAAHFAPSGLSQGWVNTDPMVLGGTIQCQGKGQLSVLGSIRSEKNTKREGKSRLKWRGPGEYVSNRPSSGCVSICIQHVHRRDHDPPLPFPCSPHWAQQACKVTTELNGADWGTI